MPVMQQLDTEYLRGRSQHRVVEEPLDADGEHHLRLGALVAVALRHVAPPACLDLCTARPGRGSGLEYRCRLGALVAVALRHVAPPACLDLCTVRKGRGSGYGI